jgi:hypothetical protein
MATYSHDMPKGKGVHSSRSVFGLVDTWSEDERTKGRNGPETAKCLACDTESHWSNLHCEICGELLIPNPSWNILADSECSRSWGTSVPHIPHTVKNSSTSRCKSCHSENDRNSTQCNICGEPFEGFSCMSPTSVCTNMVPFRATSIRRSLNQSCRDCKASYSTDEVACPICGCISERSCTPIPEEPTRPLEWVRSTIRVRTPSGSRLCSLCPSSTTAGPYRFPSGHPQA